MIDDQKRFVYLEVLGALQINRFTGHIKRSYRTTLQEQSSGLVKTVIVLDPRRAEGLRSADGIHSVECLPEAGEIIHVEQETCYLYGVGEKTTFMLLRNTLEEDAMVCGEGTIASQLLTVSQRENMGSLIHLGREVTYSPCGILWTDTIEICFVRAGYPLDRFTPVLKNHDKEANFCSQEGAFVTAYNRFW